MLNKLLFKNQDRLQLIIAVIGAFLGITFLMASIHYLIKVNEFGEGAEILGPNTLIVQKKVSQSSSLGLTKTDFTQRELEKIQELDFISEVQPVVSNNFDVWFQTNDKLAPEFKTSAFIQTVDPDFLDVKLDNWKWKKGDDFVPIIMPRDIFVMLNTFLSAEGKPQISDEVVMSVKCQFAISNGRKKEWVDCRVVGFTNEVSSMLVPQSFMQYGNDNFSDGSEQKVTQVMISSEEGKFGELEGLLDERGLESKNSQLVVGRLKSIAGTLFSVVMSISIIAVILSGLVLIQYMQLLITRNQYEVRTLIRVGYHPGDLIQKFFRYFVKIFGVVTLLSVSVFFVLKYFLDDLFTSSGIAIDQGITLGSILAIVLAYVIFSLTSYFSAKKGIFNQY